MTSVSSTALQQSSLSILTDEKLRVITRHHRAYYYAFLVTIALCWSPSKLLAYFSPWLALGIFLLISRNRTTLHRLLLVFAVWALTLPLYALLTPGFVIHSALLSLLTYGSFIFVWAVPTRRVTGQWLSERMLSIGRWILLLQGSWGLVQGILAGIRYGTFDGAVGDAVAGTISPFIRTPDFSNPMFAVNIALLLLILCPSLVYEGKGKIAFILGILSLIAASVVHVLLFLLFTLATALVIYFPSFFLRKRGVLTVLGLIATAIVSFVLLNTNFSTVTNFATHTLEVQTPRSQVVREVFTKMASKYPWTPIIGIGTGQFSSRAGLIGTGMYFGSPANPRPLPLLPEGMSDPFRDYVLDVWLQMTFNPTVNDSSSTYKPFLSWLSVYVEWGGVAVSILLSIVIMFLWKLKKYVRDPALRLETAMIGSAIMFIFLLGIQENYWEIPQALFVGMMLLKMRYANFTCRSEYRR